MGQLIDDKMLERIERTGTALDPGDQEEMLRKFGLPADREAEYVVISGCVVMFMAIRVLKSLANIFDRAGFSCTFLAKEYCGRALRPPVYPCILALLPYISIRTG